MKTISFTLALAFLVAPAMTQARGSINRDAPSVTRTINFKNGDSVSTTFKAIRFGEGNWQSILKDKDRQDAFNKRAPRIPIGSITCSAQVVATGRTVPAGKYSLYFTVHERFGWLLNLKNKGDADAEVIRFGMKMKDSDDKNGRFSINLTPGEKTGSASITIAFGGKTVTVPITVGGQAEEKDKDKEKKGAK